MIGGSATITVTRSNGAMYDITLDADGMPVANYLGDPITVSLGDLGGTITVTLQEDRMTYLDGDGMEIMSGDTRMVGDNTYTVTMNEDGTWTGTYVHYTVTQDLGTSGESVTLIRDEAGGWWTDPDTPFSSGDDYVAANGNAYTLTIVDGEWSAVYNPATMEIAGTGLTAVANEEGDGYSVGADGMLGADGSGDVTGDDGANYRVSMNEDGMLMGMRYDVKMEAKMEIGPTESNGDSLTAASPKLSGDGTTLTIAGDDYSIGDLLGDGMASREGATFIDAAHADVTTVLRQVEALAAINAGLDRDDRTDFSNNYRALWESAGKAVGKVFGGEMTLDPLPTRGNTVDEGRVVEEFQALLTALSSAADFEEALDDDGILQAYQDEVEDNDAGKDAADVFNAITDDSLALLGATETTRFGVFAKRTSASALDDLEFKVDLAKADDTLGGIGAFAYATIKNTSRTRNMPDRGTATFTGGTTAVSGHTDPKLYRGLFDMELSFATSRVTAQVSELEDLDGNPWQYQLRDVATILLPRTTLTSTAAFNSTSDAAVVYTGFAVQPIDVPDTTFAGQILGAGSGDETALGAFGTWSIGDPMKAGNAYLAGAFGADRTGTGVDPVPDVGDGGVEAFLVNGGNKNHFEMGRSTLRPQGTKPDADDPDGFVEISIATLESKAAGNSVHNYSGNSKVANAADDIAGLLATLRAYIGVDSVDGRSATITSTTARQSGTTSGRR